MTDLLADIPELDDKGRQRLQQILQMCKAACTEEQRKQMLDDLKSNPPLLSAFIKERQRVALQQRPAKLQQYSEQQGQLSSEINRHLERLRQLGISTDGVQGMQNNGAKSVLEESK